MPHIYTEYVVYITPDGVQYPLHAPGARVLIQQDGTGMPPIEFLTQRGPFQHGETLKGFFLRPRIIEMLIRNQACNRDDYWRNRGEILTYLNPDRQAINSLTTGVLRQVTSTGEFRDINCLVQEGPAFTPHDRGVWDEFAFTDIVRFIAFDPTYFDPSQQSISYTMSGGQLVFPITFPISFNDGLSTQNISYLGNWPTYPRIIINGPISNVAITNVSLGISLNLSTILVAGETITIDLTYGVKTVTKNDGTNMIGFLTPDSDLTAFRLEPHPKVTNGINQITITASGGGGESSVVMTWYNRYIGLGL